MKQRCKQADTAACAHCSSESGCASQGGAEPEFARSLALPREFGKCTRGLRVWVGERMWEDIDKVSKGLGISKSDWARLQLLERLYGVETARSIALDRVNAALQSGAAIGSQAGPQSEDRA